MICAHTRFDFCKRIEKYKKFKDFNSRIMVATNIFGRGIDIERVNVVINYDMPENADTYLHRVGRAGRFGTKGLAISFVSSEDDGKVLNDVQARFVVNIPALPDEIDASTYSKTLIKRFSKCFQCNLNLALFQFDRINNYSQNLN